MVGGNPFAKREGGAQKEDLLAGAERSDALWHDEEESPRPVAQPSSSFGRRRHSTSLSPESAQTESRAAVEPGAAAAELGSLPPPPPLVPPPSASEPPALGSAQEPLATGTAAGTPYYPPAPGTSGAWGSNPYGSNPYGGSPYGGGAPPGVPPPAGDGPYGAAPGDYYSTQPAYGQPAMAPAWTAGYPAADQPLTYQTFEQQGGGPPPGKMRCGGLGEQWTLFLVGLIIWPLWYVASVWYCVSPQQQKDRRQRTPFILNCIAAVVFTVVWVAIVVRSTWNCDPDVYVCW
ncbi:hypothetical protein ABPG77_003494 [Micractinium sp. CCAP 211/92]